MQHIVLVQEDRDRCRDATEVLRASHFQVTTCPEPRAAFGSVCETQPDLVILDVPSQHRAGCQLLDQLKQQEETAAIPVLLAWPTGPVVEAQRHTLEERGVHLLPKPLLSSQLLACVEYILGPPRPPEPQQLDS